MFQIFLKISKIFNFVNPEIPALWISLKKTSTPLILKKNS